MREGDRRIALFRDGPTESRMASTASPARVLVVDDEPPIRAIVRGFLEREGFIVAEAADGPAAVEQVRAFAPNIVVLDIMLPGLDGLEVLLHVRTFADPSALGNASVERAPHSAPHKRYSNVLKNRIIHGPVI